MGFIAKLQRAREVLEQQKRLSTRALARETECAGEELDELIAELIEIQQVARRDGLALVWIGETPAPALLVSVPNRDPRDYTPKHLADKILQSKSALEGERKQVTVLFADIQGSMRLATGLDSEAWHQILERYFTILAAAVHRYEGTVNQYTGDGIMALFGAPIAHEDHAQRACFAALQARDDLLRYTDELRVSRGINFGTRIGLNSGEVVVGKIGDDLRMDYTAQGSTVGVAQRIEQVAAAGRVYMSGTTQRLVESYFQVRGVGDTKLTGIDQPVALFELLSPGVARTRLDVSITRGLSRFVGRHHEMQSLNAALARAADGHGQVVGVVGDPGQGKSRLCFEFVQHCRAQGLMVVEGRCPAHGRNIPFLPILELFRAYFGIALADSSELARQKIAGSLVLLDAALSAQLPVLFEFMGVGDPKHPAPILDGDIRQRQLFEIMHRVYRAHTAERKLVVTLIDDLHWIDPGSDAFVAQMVAATAGSHSLLLLNFRPEYVAAFARKPHYQQLPLVPLGIEAATELIASLMGTDPSLATLAPRIAEWTGGNPFYTEELILALAETGHLSGKPGVYLLATDISRLQVPVNVQTVLAARIDRLPENAKRLLQSAAVIGLVFSETVLSTISELTPLDQARALDVLQSGDFVHEHALYPIHEYAFRHPLTQEVAYRSLLQQRWTVLHGAVARVIESEQGAKLDEFAALLAHHWDEAMEPAQAIGWDRRAAMRAGVADQAAARRHWARVRVLADQLPAEQTILTIGAEACVQYLSLGFRLEGSREETRQVFEMGKRFAERAKTPKLLALMTVAYGANIGLAYGDMHHFLSHTEEATRLTEVAADMDALAAVQLFRIDAFTWAGDVERALSIGLQVRESLAGDVQAGTSSIGFSSYANVINHIGIAYLFMGKVPAAHLHLEEGSRLAQRTGDLEPALWATLWLCYLSALQGDIQGTERHAVGVAELGRHFDTPMVRLFTVYAAGLAHLVAARWTDALVMFDEAYRVGHLRNCGRVGSPEVISGLAEAHLGLGDLDAAIGYATEAVDFCESNGLLHCPWPWTVKARCLIARGDAESALRALHSAAAVIAKTGANAHLGELHETCATYAQAFGGPWSQATELAAAREHYATLESTAHVTRLDAIDANVGRVSAA